MNNNTTEKNMNCYFYGRVATKEQLSISKLSRIMRENNMTADDLSKATGISRDLIELYMCKRKDINKASDRTLINLTNVLGCSFSDLME